MEFVKGIIELLAPHLEGKDKDLDWLAADSKDMDSQLKEGRDLLGKLELDMVDWLTHQGMDCSYCYLLFDKAEENLLESEDKAADLTFLSMYIALRINTTITKDA